MQNTDVGSLASRRPPQHQVDGWRGVYGILSSIKNSMLTFTILTLRKDVTEGRLCTAQFVIKLLDTHAVALSYVLHGASHPFVHSWGFYCRSLVCASSLPILVFLIRNGQAISVYTFCVLVFRWSIPRYISKLVVLMIWVFITLIIVIPYSIHMKEGYYGNVKYCKSCIVWW